MGNELSELVIHIGMHKCASTSIQDCCVENQDELLRNGIYYPENVFEQYPRQHSYLARLLRDEDYENVDEYFVKIARLSRERGVDRVFMSGEDLCTIPSRSVAAFSDIVGNYFEHRSFVMVARNAEEYLMSTYKHRLRYTGIITESEYLKRAFIFSPKKAIEIWREHFDIGGVYLHYNQIKDDFLRIFFQKSLGVNIESNIGSNVSMDFLSLQIINTFLKEWHSEEINKILWAVSQRHKGKMSFDIENKIASAFRSMLPEEEWSPIEYRGSRTLLEVQEKTVEKGHDPVAVCDKMIDLFGQLRRHFGDMGESTHDKSS